MRRNCYRAPRPTRPCHPPRPGFIYLEAVQDIPAGSELFFDYGDDYWVDRAPSTSLRRVVIDLL